MRAVTGRRARRILPVLGALCLLAGCSPGGGTARSDQAYRDAMETGASEVALGHPAQAAVQYRRALDRAILRDDAAQIHDSGFNLATAALQDGRPGDALAALDEADRALGLRGRTETSAERADLSLVRAAALYSRGDAAGGDRARGDLARGDLGGAESAAAAAMGAADPAVSARAAYLLGLCAFDRGDAAQLSAMLGKLAPSRDPVIRTDALDLSARVSLLKNQPEVALSEERSVIDGRRDEGDYNGMRRALLLAARAAAQAGDASLAARLRQEEQDSLGMLLRTRESAAGGRTAVSAPDLPDTGLPDTGPTRTR